MLEKIKIGYYSSANGIAGTEIYLRAVLLNLDYKRYKVTFFCTDEHPFLQEDRFESLIADELIEVVYMKKTKAENKHRHDEMNASGKLRIIDMKVIWRKYCHQSIKYFVGFLKNMIRMRKIIQVHPVDVLHINDDCSEPTAISAKLAGFPIVVCTLHVLPCTKKAYFNSMIEFISVRCFHKMIAVSKATKSCWCARYGIKNNKVKVIYNGLNFSDNKFLGDVDKKEYLNALGSVDGDLLVLVPGRLHFMKGHRFLVRAMPEIISSVSRVRFLFVGDGAEEKSLRQLAKRLDVIANVLFLGYRTDIIQLIKISDLIVLPSMSECLPYVLIEAYGCGKAIVASDLGGIPEIIKNKETGLLTPPGDGGKLAEAIIELLNNDSLRNKMSLKGKDYVRETFTEERMLSETYGFYDDLL
ncbi:glycosyltransferase family 4 protein [Candidatus Pacearchaeota archaeon]|nr:glycosyltransferase family 4 protein [Candidatus Pacearchaeota archaeon]